MIGRLVAHYRITKKLGEGGMGEVYLADDTSLRRQVALKFLPTSMAQVDSVRKRFFEEARSAAALHHPFICSIHEVGEVDGEVFIAMEYVAGSNLEDEIRAGALPLSRALSLACELAEALEKAHQANIVHRDLKPSNIMLTEGNHVKVMDFGLAKRMAGASRWENQITTLGGATQERMLQGTLAFMSPEQLRGLEVDPRSDIFAFGVILYQMLTGVHPFLKAEPVDTAHAILNADTPPLDRYADYVPGLLKHTVRKMLAKEVGDRYQSIHEVRTNLHQLLREEVSRPGGRSRRKGVGLLGLLLRPATAVVAGLSILFLVLWFFVPRHSNPPRSLTHVRQITDDPGREQFPSLSPDGKLVLYERAGALYYCRVEGGSPVKLSNTPLSSNTMPAFSPDGQRIVFRSDRAGGGLFVMGATGESVRRLTDFGFNPVYSPDGRKVAFCTQAAYNPYVRSEPSQLWWVDEMTGDRELITKGDAVQPAWSPNGHRIAFWAEDKGILNIWTIPWQGGQSVAVTNDPALDWSPAWSPDGRFLYFVSDRGGSMDIWRVPIDEQSGITQGELEPVTIGSTDIKGQISISQNGERIAFRVQSHESYIYKVGFDSERGLTVGNPTPITRSSSPMFWPAPSPDGDWVAARMTKGRQTDIVLVRSDGKGSLRQVTNDQYQERMPRWATRKDQNLLVFLSDRGEKYDLWSCNPDGGNLQLFAPDLPANVTSATLSPDGTRLAFTTHGFQSSGLAVTQISNVNLDDGPTQTLPPLENSIASFAAYSWSPDGRFLAGEAQGIVLYSLESESFQRVTNIGGAPVWMNDNRRLLFHENGSIFLVDRLEKKPREILSMEGFALEVPTLSRDQQEIYFIRGRTEADIWLADLAN